MKGKAANNQEKAWMSAICELGCICCRNELGIFSPAMPHHLEGKTKEGAHYKTIPLCFQHHQSGKNDAQCVSVHPYKAQFEKRYGSQEDLLQQVQELVNV